MNTEMMANYLRPLTLSNMITELDDALYLEHASFLRVKSHADLISDENRKLNDIIDEIRQDKSDAILKLQNHIDDLVNQGSVRLRGKDEIINSLERANKAIQEELKLALEAKTRDIDVLELIISDKSKQIDELIEENAKQFGQIAKLKAELKAHHPQ